MSLNFLQPTFVVCRSWVKFRFPAIPHIDERLSHTSACSGVCNRWSLGEHGDWQVRVNLSVCTKLSLTARSCLWAEIYQLVSA